MAFFFSAVAAIEIKVKKGRANEDTDEEGDEKKSSDKQQVVYWPAISYWMAVQSQNGRHVSTVPVHSSLLEVGMEVVAKALPDCKMGREEQSSAPLCTTLKDHSNHFLQNKVDISFAQGLNFSELLPQSIHINTAAQSKSFCRYSATASTSKKRWSST